MMRLDRMAWWLVAGLGGSLLLAEGLLRWRADLVPPAVQVVSGRLGPELAAERRFRQRWQSIHRPDPELGYRYQPNARLRLQGHPDFCFSVRTNGRGLRTPYEDGPVDAVMVGDSFALGYGVEEADTWTARLESSSGRKVAGLGVGGFGTIQVLRLLTTEGMRLGPGLVIWQFFKDDLEGAGRFQAWLDSGLPDFLAFRQSLDWQGRSIDEVGDLCLNGNRAGQGTTHAAEGMQCRQRRVARSIRRWLFRHMVTYELAKYALRVGSYADARQTVAQVSVGGRRMLLDLDADRAWEDFGRAAVVSGWRATRDCLQQGRDLVARQGARLVVVNVPSKEEVYRSRLEPATGNARAASPRSLAQRLTQFCAASDIPCLDLFDGFAAAAKAGSVLYYPHDAHWNRAGHALAAQLLQRWLTEHGL